MDVDRDSLTGSFGTPLGDTHPYAAPRSVSSLQRQPRQHDPQAYNTRPAFSSPYDAQDNGYAALPGSFGSSSFGSAAVFTSPMSPGPGGFAAYPSRYDMPEFAEQSTQL